MTSKDIWKKFKDVVLYIVIMLVLLFLTSSFVVQDVYAVADQLKMTPEGIAEVYAINIGAKKSNNVTSKDDKSNEIKTDDGKTIVVTEYKIGDTNDEILEYGQTIYALGFMVNPPTTQFTEELQTAVKTYQSMKGLEVTGELDRSTILSLVAENIKFEKGDSSKLLKSYQDLLVKGNYLAESEANGVFGDTTEIAVKSFQKANGLPETGKIDTPTLKALDLLRTSN
ncbi:MAG: peptidoglycan-binding domain-containing protein [Eubacteriaceae bacterium]